MRFYWFIQERYIAIISITLCVISAVIVGFLFTEMWDSITLKGFNSKNYDASYRKVVVLDKGSATGNAELQVSKVTLGDLVLNEEDIRVNTEMSKTTTPEDIDYDALLSNVQEFYSTTQTEEVIVEEVVEENTNVQVATVTPEGSLTLPALSDSSFKGYMCAHMVTAPSSSQYKFLHSGDYKFTTNADGIMMYNNYYVVAMASYYTGYKVGSTFRITLDSGTVFDVITGDEKADGDTDEMNMYRPKNGEGRGEIIEFIVACGDEGENCTQYTPTLSDAAKMTGNFNTLGFQGNVVKIEKLDDYSVSDAIN